MMQLAWRDTIDRILSETPSIHGRAGQALVATAGYEPLFGEGVVRASGLQSGDERDRFNTTQDCRRDARTTPFDASIGGGLPRGTVTEILSQHASTADPCGQSGALAILMPMLRRLTRDGRTVALVDHGAGIYPPGLAAAGVDLANVLLLRPTRRHDALWAAEECARSREIAATVLPMSRLRDLDVRRLSLAAEEGQGVMVILRPGRESGEVASGGLRLFVGGPQPALSRVEGSSSALKGGAGVPPAVLGGAPTSSSALRGGAGLPPASSRVANSPQSALPDSPPLPINHGYSRMMTDTHDPSPSSLKIHADSPDSRDSRSSLALAPPSPPTLRINLEVLRRRGAATPPPVKVEVKHGATLDVLVDAPSHLRPHRAREAAASA